MGEICWSIQVLLGAHVRSWKGGSRFGDEDKALFRCL
jgi:hypothetical protein